MTATSSRSITPATTRTIKSTLRTISTVTTSLLHIWATVFNWKNYLLAWDCATNIPCRMWNTNWDVVTTSRNTSMISYLLPALATNWDRHPICAWVTICASIALVSGTSILISTTRLPPISSKETPSSTARRTIRSV